MYGDGVYLMVKDKNLTKEAISTMRIYLKEVKDPSKSFVYKFEGVPINVQVVKRDYGFLKYPDSKFYLASEYKIPNPFNEYWKVRTSVV